MSEPRTQEELQEIINKMSADLAHLSAEMEDQQDIRVRFRVNFETHTSGIVTTSCTVEVEGMDGLFGPPDVMDTVKELRELVNAEFPPPVLKVKAEAAS